LGWKRRFRGSGPAVELAFDREGEVSVLKADFAEGDRLSSLVAIAYPGIALADTIALILCGFLGDVFSLKFFR
jgi:hypothetical protein